MSSVRKPDRAAGCGEQRPRAARALEQQLRVLQLLNRGLTTKEIAAQLEIAVGTARWHLSHIYGKLHVRNRTQAVVRARELRLM